MRLLVLVGFLFVFVAGAAAQEGSATLSNGPVTVKGYIVDAMCAESMLKEGKGEAAAAKHTKACATQEACAQSGYGVMTGDNWYPFDAKGNTLAQDYLKNTERKDNLYVQVKGDYQGKGKTLNVTSIDEVPTGSGGGQ